MRVAVGKLTRTGSLGASSAAPNASSRHRTVAGGILLIIEFSQPYFRLFRIPSENIDLVISSSHPGAAFNGLSRRVRQAQSPLSNRDCDAGHCVPLRAMVGCRALRKGKSLSKCKTRLRSAANWEYRDEHCRKAIVPGRRRGRQRSGARRLSGDVSSTAPDRERRPTDGARRSKRRPIVTHLKNSSNSATASCRLVQVRRPRP